MRAAIQTVQQVWRGAVLLFAIGVLTLPALVASAQSATGGIGGRVTNPDPANPRSQSIFIYTLEHGETKKDQLLVMNQTEEEQTIVLGSVDGVVTNSGDYTCRQEAEPIEGSGGWVRLAKKELTLAPGAEEKVDFTVTVPEQADVGEHNSCLTIQAAAAEDEDESTGGVRLRMRQAIRMIVTIPGDLHRELAIEKFGISLGAGTQNYSLTAANKGNVSADIDMKVRITSMFNEEVATVSGEYPLVPGESLTKEFTTELRPMFGGWFEATPSLRYDKRLGAFGTQNENAEYETLTGESQTMFFWPTTTGWAIIATVVILLLALIIFLIRRARHNAGLRRSAEEYTVKKGDTLQGLAEESNVSWKDIAKINKLTAPYTLVAGQRIKLPTAKKDAKTKAPAKATTADAKAEVAEVHRSTRRVHSSSSKKD